MCGIAGFSGKFSPEVLVEMGEALNHRGPDGRGEVYFTKGHSSVGLAHRRLSILDLTSAGSQPMAFSPEDSPQSQPQNALWLSYNGEIYNFPELRRDLESKGHRFKSHTDTEVILHLYFEYGIEAFSQLNGIFALALYDGRERGQRDGIQSGDLLIFRDGLGVKPLYYAESGNGFLFASEIKSLMASSEISCELDLESLKDYLSFLYAPAPRSPFLKVRKVEPGQWLLVRDGKIRNQNYYYDIPYGGGTFSQSEVEITLQLKNILKQAVHRQMISDVPLGAFLSGGLDSTSVVALMKEAQPSAPFQCFTIAHENRDGIKKNDLYYAKRVASQFGLPLTVVPVEPADFKSLEKVIFHLDEPQADPAAINALLISQKARELGIKVLLSGAGGDDIFSGYPRHRAVQLEHIWRWIPKALLQGVAHLSHRLCESKGGATFVPNEKMRKVAKVLEGMGWDVDTRIISYFMGTFPGEIQSVLGERFKSQVSEDSSFKPLLKSLDRIDGEKNILNRMLYLETKHFLADHNLNYVDKMSMAHGVEVRVPLIDKELVDFVSRIPASLKCRRLENKYIFKQAVKSVVPEAVLTRKKQGFGLPIRHWLNHELRDCLQDTLSVSSLKNRGLFDPGAVQTLIERDRTRQIDATFLIFSLMSIELWCRQFLDKSYSTIQSKERRATLPL
jgi:asparagine synthase (glutamine-hydrolysing)